MRKLRKLRKLRKFSGGEPLTHLRKNVKLIQNIYIDINQENTLNLRSFGNLESLIKKLKTWRV